MHSMTVTYSLDVASESFLSLYRLLFRWKGSVWKTILADLFLWCSIYSIISMSYRLFMTQTQREVFEDICIFFDTYSEFIPMTFMLGFYVSTVFSRWWEIFSNVGWIDSPALLVAAQINGTDEHSRMIRRNIIRYLVLTQALVFRDVAACVKRRFPTMEHLVTAGLMSTKEMEIFDEIDSPHIKYWQPMHWVFGLLKQLFPAYKEGKITDIVYVDMLDKMRQFRVNVLNLTLYDWVSVPLGYTQVVHLAVRSYFLVALLGRQYLNTTRNIEKFKTVDLYVPIMTLLQFVFFVGWMKVAEVLLNPLGEDDDDFECNYILDRNLQVGMAIVDEAYKNMPPLEKDVFWDTHNPLMLYTTEAAARPVNPNIGSCVVMATEYDKVAPEDEAVMVLPRRRPSRDQRLLSWDATAEVIVPVRRRRPSYTGSPLAMKKNGRMKKVFSSASLPQEHRDSRRNSFNSELSRRSSASSIHSEAGTQTENEMGQTISNGKKLSTIDEEDERRKASLSQTNSPLPSIDHNNIVFPQLKDFS